MSLQKTLQLVAVVAAAMGGVNVGALAQDGVRDDAFPALAASQEPPPEPAPEAPGAAAPHAAPSLKPGRPAAAPKAAPGPRPPGETPPPAGPRGEHVNVRIELKIRAQKGSSPPTEKTLALVTVGDNSPTAIRTKSSIPYRSAPIPTAVQYQSFSLNADARAIVEGRRITFKLTLDFEFASQAHEGEVEGRAAGPMTSSVTNVIQAVLEDGKPLVVSDQVDAASDYRVTVEAKATILR